MTWMKKHWLGLLLALAAFSAPWVVGLRAQTAIPFQMAVGTATHASCTVTAATTQYCFASDGLWVSLAGAAYTQIGVVAVTGVTSVTVCNAAGATCGTPQTGVVSLNIPKSVSVTATLPTATLQ
jgi:hypothetical protein